MEGAGAGNMPLERRPRSGDDEALCQGLELVVFSAEERRDLNRDIVDFEQSRRWIDAIECARGGHLDLPQAPTDVGASNGICGKRALHRVRRRA